MGIIDDRTADTIGLLRAVDGQSYDYGGAGEPGRSYDCSGDVCAVIRCMLGDNPPQGFHDFSTESWRLDEPSGVGPYGMRPGMGPDGTAVQLIFHHGGGGPDSHVEGFLWGKRFGSNGAHGVFYDDPSRETRIGYFDGTPWYLPNELIGSHGNPNLSDRPVPTPVSGAPVSQDCLYADVSYYQTKVDDSYPYRFISIRSNDGTFRDPNYADNLDWCKRACDSGRLDGFAVYVVYRANWLDCLNVHKDMTGTPHPKMSTQMDVETWGGEIRGNHSDLINRFYWGLVDWYGNKDRVFEYGGAGDLNQLHPTKPDGIRIAIAAYGSDPDYPGKVVHQYTDGQGYGGGLPEGAPPFGNCDMNAADGLDAKALATVLGSAGQMVIGAILDHYNALGGQGGFLGAPSTTEITCPDGIGRYNHFASGSIYWDPDTGAWEVHGGIRDHWAALGWERSVLGYPVTDEQSCPDGKGRFNHFQQASLYWSPDSGAFEVHGLVRDKWAKLGWETSFLGYPTSDETFCPQKPGKYNHFQNGSIYWDGQASEVFTVHGAIWDAWQNQGWENGSLGFPTSDEIPTSTGVRQNFQGGALSFDSNTGQVGPDRAKATVEVPPLNGTPPPASNA